MPPFRIDHSLTDSPPPEPITAEQPEHSHRRRWWGKRLDFVKWSLACLRARTILPFSKVTLLEYVQRRMEENTLESLQEVVRLVPKDGLA